MTSVRLRQAVLAARDLDAVAGELRATLSLAEPFSDPGVAHFGLRNAVFALQDTFLEVVSPIRADTSAGRLLDRRAGDCGYMVMLQVEDLGAARERARAHGVREVFAVALPDMEEVHLHPADMRGAIVALSRPRPTGSWRWGGPEWEQRAAPLRIAGAAIAVADPTTVARRWRDVTGGGHAVRFRSDASEPGLVEVTLSGLRHDPVEIGGVRFRFADDKEES